MTNTTHIFSFFLALIVAAPIALASLHQVTQLAA